MNVASVLHQRETEGPFWALPHQLSAVSHTAEDSEKNKASGTSHGECTLAPRGAASCVF